METIDSIVVAVMLVMVGVMVICITSGLYLMSKWGMQWMKRKPLGSTISGTSATGQ